MKITSTVIAIITDGLRKKRISKAALAEELGHGRAWSTKLLDGSMQTLSEAETKRLGALCGGWRKNALRHSWISYRAAEVGLAQTAMEAGNSESEARRSYNDAKGRDESGEWFGLTRDRVAELTRNP